MFKLLGGSEISSALFLSLGNDYWSLIVIKSSQLDFQPSDLPTFGKH